MNRLEERTVRALIRRIVEAVEEPRAFDWIDDKSAREQLHTAGWTVVTLSREVLRPSLRVFRDEGLHAATHNDGGVYAVLVSKRPIKSITGAVQKITQAGEWQKPIGVGTLSIRF